MSETDLTPVSHEQDGRILTGVGVDVADLQATMDRHTPDPEPSSPTEPEPPTSEPVSTQTRDEAGKFVKPARGQKRFDQLTAERETEKRRADAAERDRESLRAELEAARRPAPVAPAAAPVEPTKASATRPKPTEAEVGEKYQTYGDYVEDLADWKAEQRLASLDLDARVRTSIEADRASRTFADQMKTTFSKGREAYADFDAVFTNGPGLQVVLGASVENGKARVEYISTLPGSEHLLYQIAKDANLAHRLAGLSDVAFGLEVARLIPSAPVAVPASTRVPGASIAPAPYQPVGSGSKTTVAPLEDLPHKAGFDFDKSGYRERRAADLKRGGFRRP